MKVHQATSHYFLVKLCFACSSLWLPGAMGRRWIKKEEDALVEVRKRLKDLLAARPQFPEVVGDRRLLRFLRGKSLNLDESVKSIKNFLKWRDDNKVDDIRQAIVYGGRDSPFKFPFGKEIIDIAPQIVISANSLDKKGRPLALETFDFSPKEIFEATSIEDYLVFLTYTLEYRALVLEQMSHEREQKYLSEHTNPDDRTDGYGVIVMDFTIRDLKGVGMGHLGSKGRAMVSAALELSLPNYPEYLDKCVMLNTPWIFNTFWYFIKGFLDEITMAKINLLGATYMPQLLEDISFENIPERCGGGFKQYNEHYEFDRTPSGPLHYEGCPKYVPSTSTSDNNGAGTTETGASGRSAQLGLTSTTAGVIGTSASSSQGSTGHAYSAQEQEILSMRRLGSKEFTVRKWLCGLAKHTPAWVARNPIKALVGMVWLLVFVYLRVTGWLQVLVFPSIIVITLFDTRPLSTPVLQYFDLIR